MKFLLSSSTKLEDAKIFYSMSLKGIWKRRKDKEISMSCKTELMMSGKRKKKQAGNIKKKRQFLKKMNGVIMGQIKTTLRISSRKRNWNQGKRWSNLSFKLTKKIFLFCRKFKPSQSKESNTDWPKSKLRCLMWFFLKTMKMLILELTSKNTMKMVYLLVKRPNTINIFLRKRTKLALLTPISTFLPNQSR